MGIPFAEPPVGDLRWRAPRPLPPWDGRFEATRPGKACVQFGGMLSGTPEDERGQVTGSEDCLTLNVFAPRMGRDALPAGDQALPVMVWIHGGGNSIGTASTYANAANLAEKHRVIVVTTNYRLGVIGWLLHPALHEEGFDAADRSGNFGTLDLIQSLTWVRDNIAGFGGNPGNVTVFGESAGGINIFSLLVAPGAKGLFHKAILQSPLPFSNSPEAAMNFSGELVASLLLRDGKAKDAAEARTIIQRMSAEEIRDYLRSRSPEQLLAPYEGAVFGMYSVPYLIRDGAVLPTEPPLALLGKAGTFHDVPVLLGTNRDEYKLFLFANDEFTSLLFGKIPRIKDEAKYDHVASALSRTWRAIGSDLPGDKLRSAQPRVFSYRFDWDEGPKNLLVDMPRLLGAAHGLEISLVFQDFENDAFEFATRENLPGRREVGEAMGSYWTQFAWTGDPGRGRNGKLPQWQDFSGGFLVFDTAADGGIRMAQGRESVEAVMKDVLTKPSGGAITRDDCRLAAGVYDFVLGTGMWQAEQFPSIVNGQCDAWTFDALRPARQ